MDKKQKANLRKLADGLLQLSARYKHFEMDCYCGSAHDELKPTEATAKNLRHCGTAGCAVGHGPSFGIKPHRTEDWGEYSERVFGASYLGTPSSKQAFIWCFHGSWDRLDNTPKGAALRILYMLDYGAPSDVWDFQDITHIHVGLYENAYDIVTV